MSNKRLKVVVASVLSFLSATSGAHASQTNDVANTTVNDIYVATIAANSIGNATSFWSHAPYFEIRFTNASGGDVDLCSDQSGIQTRVYVYPGSNNKDVLVSVLQMALLNQRRLQIKTEAISQSAPNGTNVTLCFLKHVVLYK